MCLGSCPAVPDDAALIKTASLLQSNARPYHLTSLSRKKHHGCMRTTLSIDDDVLREVKVYADSRDIALGKAVSELVRRGLQAPLQTRLVNGFHVVDLPHGSPTVTGEQIRKLQEELE